MDLLRASTDFINAQSTAAAKHAAGIAAEKATRSNRDQAIAQLNTICEDAIEAIEVAGFRGMTLKREIGPDAKFVLEGEDVFLEIEEWWLIFVPRVVGHGRSTVVSAAGVRARNRRSKYWESRSEATRDYPVRLANLLSEVSEGRVVWNLIRFTCLESTGHYQYWPKETERGMRTLSFEEYLREGRAPGVSEKKSGFTADSLVKLYAEALSLPPDAYPEHEIA
jgi:hypothetical protein